MIPKPKNIERVVSFLIRWDGIWSVPLLLLVWIGFLYAGEYFWGNDFGGMTPSYYHAVIYAMAVLVSLNFAAWLGIRLNHKTVWDFYRYQYKLTFDSLTNVQKLCALLFLYSLYMLSGIIVLASVV